MSTVRSLRKSSGASYRLTRTICFDDIRHKFSRREFVSTDKFYCQYDPSPIDYKLNIEFGTKEEGYLGVFICPVSRDATLTRVQIELYDGRCNLMTTITDNKTQEYRMSGRRGWITKQKFDATSPPSLRVIIDFIYKASPNEFALTTVDQPKLRLQNEYGRLLDSGDESDVTLVVQGEKIKAHKLVLTTRCEVFGSMFDAGMAEGFSKEVVITDFTPKAIKEFLKFLYTGVSPKYGGHATMELLAAADKYCVNDLKVMCARAISSNLNGNNVIDALLLAEKHYCSTLMTSAIAVFGSHAKALKSTKAWNKLIKSPTLLLKLIEHFV